jgi:hypothetical protein
MILFLNAVAFLFVKHKVVPEYRLDVDQFFIRLQTRGQYTNAR